MMLEKRKSLLVLFSSIFSKANRGFLKKANCNMGKLEEWIFLLIMFYCTVVAKVQKYMLFNGTWVFSPHHDSSDSCR